MAKNPQMKVDDQLFYAPHGVVTLTAIEQRDFGGSDAEFYILELERGGTLLLPTTSLPDNTFRKLVSARKAKELLKSVNAKIAPTWDETIDSKARAELYGKQLRDGEADIYTTIMHDLMYRARQGKITSGEQRVLEQARAYFLGEIGSVLKMDHEKIQAELAAAMADVQPAPKS